MRIIRIIFSGLLAFGLIACTILFIFYQTFDTDQFLPQISQKISSVVGRPVSVGSLWLGFSNRGMTLNAGPVIIGDDPAFTIQPFIKIDEVRLSVDLRSLIFHRQILIKKVILITPQIHFIRSMDRDFNVHAVVEAKAPAGDPGWAPKVQNNFVHSRHRQMPIVIKFVKIRSGAISFIDQNPAFPLDIWLNDVNVNLSDFSSSQPLHLTFNASLYKDLPNVRGEAFVFWTGDLSRPAFRITGFKLEMDLSHLDPEWLKSISPEMPRYPMVKNISGLLQLNIAQMTASSSGLTVDGQINISNGVIKDFNVINMVLSRTLGILGGMEIDINGLLGGQLKNKVNTSDTVIKDAKIGFSIRDKTLFIDTCHIETNILDLDGHGSVDQALKVDMQTMLHLNQDVSSALVNELGGFQGLMDDTKRIAVGAALTGVYPHLKYKTDKDFRKKSRKALMKEGGNVLGILLGGIK